LSCRHRRGGRESNPAEDPVPPQKGRCQTPQNSPALRTKPSRPGRQWQELSQESSRASQWMQPKVPRTPPPEKFSYATP